MNKTLLLFANILSDLAPGRRNELDAVIAELDGTAPAPVSVTDQAGSQSEQPETPAPVPVTDPPAVDPVAVAAAENQIASILSALRPVDAAKVTADLKATL